MKNQSKIDTEQDGALILAKLLQYGKGLVWTDGIFADTLGWKRQRVERAMAWLIKSGYVSRALGSYVSTDTGKEFYANCQSQSKVDSPRAWIDEARTGLRATGPRNNADWQRSNIYRAAIPGVQSHPLATDETPEVVVSRDEQCRQRIRAAANELGISIRELRTLLKQDRVRVCRGRDGTRHLGIFHKKGKGWQSLCRDCRKKRK